MNPVLKVENVKKHFIKKSFLGKDKVTYAVDEVSFSVNKGDTLGIVGESGCGKSTMANLLVRLEDVTDGKIIINDKEISSLSEKELRAMRHQIQIIFQDPYSSLNPRFSVEEIVTEPMRVKGGWTRDEMKEKAISLLELVGLNKSHLSRYPHEFSGGQRQRISIARALTTEPEILILDEPTSALDVSVQAQVLQLLMNLQKKLGLTYIFISHNLAVVKCIANRTAVMYLGKIMEMGLSDDIMLKPIHPYTNELITAVPSIGKPLDMNINDDTIKLGKVREGCLYYPRCKKSVQICSEKTPILTEIRPEHWVACWEAKNFV